MLMFSAQNDVNGNGNGDGDVAKMNKMEME